MTLNLTVTTAAGGVFRILDASALGPDDVIGRSGPGSDLRRFHFEPDDVIVAEEVPRSNVTELPAIGARVFISALGIHGTVTEITPGHDYQRIRLDLGHGEFFDTSDVALGIRA